MTNNNFLQWRPHPWHGLSAGSRTPEFVTAYIELTPFDSVKYEVDKKTGYIKIDRPQKTNMNSPLLYGFIPQTYCGDEVQKLSPTSLRGDCDPLDICVISERPINRGDVILAAKVIGGLQMVDNEEADDKIIGILETDNIYSSVNDISDLPQIIIQRLKHYFLQYKSLQNQNNSVTIPEVYGREKAQKVVSASSRDYKLKFPHAQDGIQS